MKMRKKTIAVLGMAFSSGALIVSSLVFANHQEEANKPFVAYGLEISDEDTQYLGYGYDVTSGKAISDPNALKLANPILDVDNPELIKYEKAFSSSQTNYLSYSSTSAKEVAEQYGITLGGGINGNIKGVTLAIDSKFNTNTSFSKKVAEEYSYYSIYAKNRTVVIQAGADELSNYLNASFLKNAKGITTVEDADNFYEKYGTHLLTGYNLGGIFEMTNYYATSSTSYVRQNEVSFSQQVDAAMSFGEDFSFSATYGLLDNNAYAVNNYKCTTYGGYTFPGLTIDQAFSYYETAFGAGYIYGLWTDSINAGKNLSIVSVPESSKMIPLYNLLPDGPLYDNARSSLLTSYIKKCGLAYSKFIEAYPDINPNYRPNHLSPSDIGFSGYGFSEYKLNKDGEYLTTYTSSDEYTSKASVARNDIVAMDYNQSLYYGYNVVWQSEDSDIEVLDARNGVLKVKENAAKGEHLISLTVDGQRLYSLYFDVITNGYSGGAGTESNPFLIANINDLYDLCENYSDWNAAFKLTADIEFDTRFEFDYDFKTIGRYVNNGGSIEFKPFTGIFDGNYHSIRHFKLYKNNVENAAEETYLGLFGYSNGLIKNLTIEAYENDEVSGDYSDVKNIITNFNSNYNALFGNNDENLYTLYRDKKDKLKPENVLSNVRYVGGVVGYNAGSVINCTVKNMDIRYMDINEINAGGVEINTPSIGLVVGHNDQYGVINNCHVEDSSIRAFKYTNNSSYSHLAIGGVVGYNDSQFAIYSCSADKIGIQAANIEGKTSDYATKFNYVGGIAGSSVYPVNDCLVKNLDGKNPNRNSDDIPYGLASYIRAKDDSISYVSALVGVSRITSVETYHRNIMMNINRVGSSFINGSYVASASKGNVTTTSMRNIEGVSYSIPNFDNCYYTKDDKTDLYEGFNGNNGGSNLSGVETFNGRYDILPEVFKENGYWIKGEDHSPSLIRDRITLNNISFDFSNTKKVFYVTNGKGEAFQSGEIIIEANTTSGEIVRISNYEIDASEYESKKNVPGDVADIIVTANGVSAKYQVRIIEPSAIGIKVVEDSSIEVDYYAGDLFNPEGLVVQAITQTGVNNEPLEYVQDLYAKLSSSDPSVVNSAKAKLAAREYFEIEDVDRALVKGFNNFLITYFDAPTNKTYSALYPVYAKTARVASIQVEESSYIKVNGENRFALPVGTQTISAIDLVGLEISVSLDGVSSEYDARVLETTSPHTFKICFEKESVYRNKLLIRYDDPALADFNREIDADEVEFISSTIKHGTNQIKVCYQGYLVDRCGVFEIEGVYADMSEKLEEFNNIIAKYDEYMIFDDNEHAVGLKDVSSMSLRERYEDIKEALKLKDELKSLSGDTDYIEACQKLELIINEYNADINGVNEAMIESVRVTTSFYHQSLLNSGFLALSLIFAILFFVL